MRKAIFDQLGNLAIAHLAIRAPHRDHNNPPPIAKRRRGETKSRALRVAGLEAIHARDSIEQVIVIHHVNHAIFAADSQPKALYAHAGVFQDMVLSKR